MVARMAGTGSPAPSASDTANRQLERSGSTATQRMAWSPDPTSTGPCSASPVWAYEARYGDPLCRLAGRAQPGIRLEAGRDPALGELRLGRIGVGDEVPAQLLGQDRPHEHLEPGVQRQQPGDDVAAQPRTLAHAQPVDRGDDQIAGGEGGHRAEIGSGGGRRARCASEPASATARASAEGVGTGVGVGNGPRTQADRSRTTARIVTARLGLPTGNRVAAQRSRRGTSEASRSAISRAFVVP